MADEPPNPFKPGVQPLYPTRAQLMNFRKARAMGAITIFRQGSCEVCSGSVPIGFRFCREACSVAPSKPKEDQGS